MRIDKLLCELNIGSRSQVKELIKKGNIKVNGELVTRPEARVDEKKAFIVFKGKEYRYRPFVYFAMNKPAGVVTATEDRNDKTVMDVFKEYCTDIYGSQISGIPLRDIFPVGRLDKDTVGLLVLTNDGAMAHELLFPSRHVPKTYLVRLDGALSAGQVSVLEAGVLIGEKEKTLPAKLEFPDSGNHSECYLTITEGKFHQVKRMFQAVGQNVFYLKRISMGSLRLDESIQEGSCRELSEEEVRKLCLKI